MSIIGKSLIHYEITDQIGKGGMGEVYQAKDTKLGREVAIKVLPEEFARDTDRVARFQREAKLLASLNHPNIAAIYGLEESDGTHFLVMELIEGDTLRDRIKSGPIPVEEALKLALQMAEALEAAHENGVIHRDLKPANIKVTPDGKVKILDFGLAKAYVGDPDNLTPADSPTLSAAATRQGVILGTAAYMSPEQARGKLVDKRADIWAFGVVLFEMLTGKNLFSGEDVTSTVARVLEREPDFSTLPQNLHSRIQFMLERCLKKNPKDRYSGISDARVDIQSVLADPSGLFVQPSVGFEPKKRTGTTITWSAVVVLTALIVGAVIWNLREPEPRRIIRLTHELPEGIQVHIDATAGWPALAVSPDGSQVAYSTNKGIFLRSVDELDAKLIAGSDENAEDLFFSPDGQWIGYVSTTDRKLKKISVSGGVPIPLCDIGLTLFGAGWYSDDTIVFSMLPDGVMRISASGGTPETIIGAELTSFPVFPQLLPDGEVVLFTNFTNFEDRTYQIMTQSIKSGDRKELFAGIGASYVSTGHILYSGENNHYAVPFDMDRLEVTGGAVPILEGVGATFFSESGTLVYVPMVAPAQSDSETESTAVPETERTLWWVDRNGHEERIEAPARDYYYPKISPDGKKIALNAAVGGNDDIWVLDLLRGNLPRLTFNESNDMMPLWSPDGLRIAYSATNQETITAGGLMGVFCKSADGTGKTECLGISPGKILLTYSWSGDGKIILVVEMDSTLQKIDIGMISTDGDRSYRPLLNEDYMETYPQLSPDGRWLAYCSDESGETGTQVYVRAFPDVNSGGRWQVSTDSRSGSACPLWSPDGKELFYLLCKDNGTVAKAVVAVPVETEPTFNPGKPKVLFEGKFVGPAPVDGIPYDIHPDGERFLMMKESGTIADESSTEEAAVEGPREITIVLNWFEELKERVPVE